MPVPNSQNAATLILGAGVTGLAAGISSGGTVLEQNKFAGGICSSYYRTTNAGAYRFEHGGGHWIFGGERNILNWIEERSACKSYNRLSAVYFPDRDLYVPYPIQNHLSSLGEATARSILEEIEGLANDTAPETMRDWLLQSFGPSMCELFFFPFHEAYTAGLYERIAPQDAQKSPVDIATVRKGARGEATEAGYNINFRYPERGLDDLVGRMVAECAVVFDREIIAIDPKQRNVRLASGETCGYERLISTLPLHTSIKMAGLTVPSPADPFTSVLVLNIGGTAGPRCPDHHWLYIPRTLSGFHRVGFYSNVDSAFAPPASSGTRRVSIYVEKAYLGGETPTDAEIAAYEKDAIAELRQWGYLDAVDVIDRSWVPVAYTWSWPGSTWVSEAIAALEQAGIEPVGRYARWHFQGIADSIRDGLNV